MDFIGPAFVLLVVVGTPAFIGFLIGYYKSAKKYPTKGPRILIGILCAIGCVLLLAAIAFGACLCLLSGVNYH